MPKRRSSKPYERYALERSPFAQKPTQRDVASLVKETRDDLRKFATPRFKEQFLVRREIESGGKVRNLVYPVSELRRKARSQRDNAAAHLDAHQYLTLDIKQFYPSTTRSMIRASLADQFGMAGDVAGLIAHVATADEQACFGSPLTPVLATLVHRPMFDAIADLCAEYDLEHTVWVDDVTISGILSIGIEV